MRLRRASVRCQTHLCEAEMNVNRHRTGVQTITALDALIYLSTTQTRTHTTPNNARIRVIQLKTRISSIHFLCTSISYFSRCANPFINSFALSRARYTYARAFIHPCPRERRKWTTSDANSFSAYTMKENFCPIPVWHTEQFWHFTRSSRISTPEIFRSVFFFFLGMHDHNATQSTFIRLAHTQHMHMKLILSFTCNCRVFSLYLFNFFCRIAFASIRITSHRFSLCTFIRFDWFSFIIYLKLHCSERKHTQRPRISSWL